MIQTEHNDGETSEGSEENESESSIVQRLPSISSIAKEDVKINFEFLRTTKVNNKWVYVIMIMKDTGFDADQIKIERSFSNFSDLHDRLKKECPYAVQSIDFPKKTMFRPTENEAVERSRYLKKYLTFVAHQGDVMKSNAFQHFFCIPHIKKATELLKCEEYSRSRTEYFLAFQLQKKLDANKEEIIPTICGAIETNKNLKDFKAVNDLGEECLSLLSDDNSNPYLLPLLYSVIDARKRLNLDTSQLQIKLRECDRKGKHDSEIETLRELLVRRY
ncbi:uncharacterized protein LOC105848502 isoform X1 [Hydra vulgaris]|uniref:Sorting nexin-21 n=1 Tax=Hydra vulgaris TaxID=6087 RepID=T2M7J9_HYDVU|nr:uncharacterized protein LOC105848502 [Hydra vulgaris]